MGFLFTYSNRSRYDSFTKFSKSPLLLVPVVILLYSTDDDVGCAFVKDPVKAVHGAYATFRIAVCEDWLNGYKPIPQTSHTQVLRPILRRYENSSTVCV
ncbi:hypothetical protein CDAR_586921 [Caerostris darwini]|uniref:Uncharacterized protein n=1 Tax=Caerostris darwini TaxID=1538125 RepID=A0AAV4VI15_9ARAC|nr:hypothetical protein CDAR_586921 [Caerostris darwini]